jgi:hypothetical protein
LERAGHRQRSSGIGSRSIHSSFSSQLHSGRRWVPAPILFSQWSRCVGCDRHAAKKPAYNFRPLLLRCTVVKRVDSMRGYGKRLLHLASHAFLGTLHCTPPVSRWMTGIGHTAPIGPQARGLLRPMLYIGSHRKPNGILVLARYGGFKGRPDHSGPAPGSSRLSIINLSHLQHGLGNLRLILGLEIEIGSHNLAWPRQWHWQCGTLGAGRAERGAASACEVRDSSDRAPAVQCR